MDLEKIRVEYLRFEDPTEYYFALKIIGSWKEWEDFCNNNQQFVEDLRRELEAKIRSNALLSIIEASKGSNRDALVASKYLLELPWVKQSSKRGRPSKEEVLKETKKMAEDTKRVVEDYNRLGHVTLTNG